jgi:CheY-like chemotaxis protein
MPDKRTVLVVDDERQIAQVACIRLKNAGYRTITATDGEEAVSMALEAQPDAIVLDVRMPRMDGLTALAQLRLRSQTQDIPVVMLSASLIDKPAAMDAGARFFLTKPFDAPTLIAAVNRAVEEACSAVRRPPA